jgi:hypothetical protein
LQGRLAELESRLSSDSPVADFTTTEPTLQRAYEMALKLRLHRDYPVARRKRHRENRPGEVRSRAQSAKGECVRHGELPESFRELLEANYSGTSKALSPSSQRHLGKGRSGGRSTLFLDEIGELPLEIQPKLLRLLQERNTNAWARQRSAGRTCG